MKRLVCCIAILFLAACASYDGRGLQPGSATLADVLRTMGEPALRWENPDGSLQLSYPRGRHSYMVHLGPDGRLQRIENVMDMATFARIRAGMSEAEVLRLLGPSDPAETAYFPARRELVREWRYCDDWNHAAWFGVLFDSDRGSVRSTSSRREECYLGPCFCGH